MPETNRNNGRKTDGKFASGNAGRPKGSRHKTTLAIQALLDGEGEALTRKAVEMALAARPVGCLTHTQMRQTLLKSGSLLSQNT